MFFGGGFNAKKLKPQLKMAVGRIQISSNKKAALQKQNLREVAKMLAEDPPREEKARIRAEALIRDDNLIEAYEILQLECELLHERIKLLEYSKDCPPDLITVVSTLMWASHRVDIQELVLIRKQFRAKYGKDFEDRAMRNEGGVLNERVVHKLSVDPPAAALVQIYLERICEQHEVEWEPKMKLTAVQLTEPMSAPVGFSVGVAQGTGLGVTAEELTSQSPPPTIVTATQVMPYVPPKMDVTEPEISVSATVPANTMSTLTKDNDEDESPSKSDSRPSAPTALSPSNETAGGHTTTYDDLAARFESLKK